MTVVAQYETREMLDALKIEPPPITFLQKMLVKREVTHDTTIVEIDTERAGQKLAAYVSRVGTGEAVGKDDFTTALHLLPYTRQVQTFTAADLANRVAGETIYEGSPSSRADMAVGKFLRKAGNRNDRLREKQLADAIITGKQTVSGKGFVDYEIDYQRNASCTGAALTTTSRWGESGATIVANLRAGQAVLTTPGIDGGYATDLVLGVNAGQNFVDSDEITGRLDYRRLDGGMISPTLLKDEFATYVGTFRDVGVSLDVWMYSGQYVDSAGSAQYYFNTNGMALINRSLRCETHYSMISNFKSGNFIGREFPLYWISENGAMATAQLESGFVVATHEPNKIYYRQVGNG